MQKAEQNLTQTAVKKNLKKLTLLHSNDMHGDFLAEKIDCKLVGGVSLLSGYVNKVRAEEKMCSIALLATCSAAPLSTLNSRVFLPLRL